MATIKDSGERTQFETGAVRDMHEGKGRMDLLPWAAAWNLLWALGMVQKHPECVNTTWRADNEQT